MGFDVEQEAPEVSIEIEDSNEQEKDHEQLTGRDAADAHPIGSITGLRAELDALWAEFADGEAELGI